MRISVLATRREIIATVVISRDAPEVNRSIAENASALEDHDSLRTSRKRVANYTSALAVNLFCYGGTSHRSTGQNPSPFSTFYAK